jgi:YidC/Oxa1 family membrane protein insertase
MQRIAPLMKDLQEKMKGRPPEEQQKKMIELQKEHNINMTGGCLPMVLQAAVLIPVFYMVRMYEYQFSKGYFLWIGSDLSHQWPQWFAPNLASFDVPMFALYMGSTILTSLLQPKPADPAQAQQQKMMMWMMPIMFGWMMWQGKWSSAFMFYWLVQNLVSMWQNWMLLRHFGPPPTGSPTVVAEGPVQPMQSGPATNGNGRRPTTGRVHTKKKKKGSRA